MPAATAAPRPLLGAGPRLRRKVCRAQVSAGATPLDDSERLASDFRRLNRLQTLGGAPPSLFLERVLLRLTPLPGCSLQTNRTAARRALSSAQTAA